MMRLKSIAAIASFMAISCVSLFGQEASITGTVTDDTKAVIPGTTVTAANLATGARAISVSDERGQYRILQLTPGTYTLQAERDGFTTLVIQSIELLVGQNATMPITLKVAQTSEKVTVTSEVPLVDTGSSEVSGNVNPRQMEDLPLLGNDWLELSKMVEGITANVISTTGPGVFPDFYQLNLDGQQVTQRISTGFGQPIFSRDSIAEFQIVTNNFDITQGRSVQMQVQAVTRAGTNQIHGSAYAYFRSDALNAADALTHTVLPYSDQLMGGTIGGPIKKDRLFYFGSYEHERNPGTSYIAPAELPGETWTIPYEIGRSSYLARLDYDKSPSNRLMVRFTRFDNSDPFVAGGTPSDSYSQTQEATNLVGTWTNVLSANKVQEITLGYNNFQWGDTPLPQVGNTFAYDFPGLTLGKPYNYPEWLYQKYGESHYSLDWHHNAHDFKLGGEFLWASVSALWYLQQAGIMTFTSVPANITSLIPQSDPYNVSAWNLSGLDPLVLNFAVNYSNNGWKLSVPGPTWGMWFGDTWHVNSRLTINYGLRWDDAWDVASTPGIVPNTIMINNGSSSATTYIPGMGPGNFGYSKNIRDNTDFAPRGGFAWNVGGKNSLVIRGGTGIYYSFPQTEFTYSPQLYSNLITDTFPNTGQASFITNPTGGISTYQQAQANLQPQAARVISSDFHDPWTWQSSLGFQKQLNDATSIQADLVHYNEYDDIRTIDPNLIYNPATGYSENVSTAGYANPAYAQIAYFVSTGSANYTALQTALNRRFRKHFQAGVTYTLEFEMHDDGSNPSPASPAANNQFNYLNGEWATSTIFQRNTVRGWVVYQLPWGISTSVSYAYGSGDRYADSIPVSVYGKPGTNRLNLTATGGPTNAITVPADMLGRWDGPAMIPSGALVPRDGLEGTTYSKADVRVTKEFSLTERVKLSLIGEVYNLFNHANYTGFNSTLSATSAATTAAFGHPNADDIPREAQLAIRVKF